MKKGFTLAETLSMLSIICIIATVTLPGLNSKHQEMETILRLKKAYITLNDAYEQGFAEHGSPVKWELNDVSDYATNEDYEGSKNMYNAFGVYIKKKKDCQGKSGCFADKYFFSNGAERTDDLNTAPHRYKIITNDNMSMAFHAYSHDCSRVQEAGDIRTICGLVFVDINGPNKGKNMMGDDLFVFYLAEDGIFPQGAATDTCLYSDCMAKGEHCTKWVIENENRDYLKCKDLSWSGKTKCSK